MRETKRHKENLNKTNFLIMPFKIPNGPQMSGGLQFAHDTVAQSYDLGIYGLLCRFLMSLLL